MSVLANAAVSDPALAAPIAQSSDWRQAATDLIKFLIGMDRCFSSGEVAAILRTHRPDLRFSVPNLGEFIRDLFYSQQMPEYLQDADNGTGTMIPVPVTMSPRFTVGLYPDRTPAGVQVFVYGPSAGACDAHEFEVFVPNPGNGETMASAPPPAKGIPQPIRGGAPLGHTVTAPFGTKTGVYIGGDHSTTTDIVAKVAKDGRMYITRSAFETAVHLGGTPLRGGDPVYVQKVADTIVVTLVDDGTPGVKTYNLWKAGGRIALDSGPFGNGLWKDGDSFPLKIEAGKITVLLGQ